jgi:hypothetical protein
MTEQNSELSTPKTKWREIDSGISFEESIDNQSIRELYEHIETLAYTDTPFVLTCHISAHAELEEDDEYQEFQAPTTYLQNNQPGAVSYIVFQLGKHLAGKAAGFRVQDFWVDNEVNRYTVKILLRPIGLPDLVNLNR